MKLQPIQGSMMRPQDVQDSCGCPDGECPGGGCPDLSHPGVAVSMSWRWMIHTAPSAWRHWSAAPPRAPAWTTSMAAPSTVRVAGRPGRPVQQSIEADFSPGQACIPGLRTVQCAFKAAAPCRCPAWFPHLRRDWQPAAATPRTTASSLTLTLAKVRAAPAHAAPHAGAAISSPDNLSVMDDFDILLIGEDTSLHQNDFVWAMDLDTGALLVQRACMYDAELAGGF